MPVCGYCKEPGHVMRQCQKLKDVISGKTPVTSMTMPKDVPPARVEEKPKGLQDRIIDAIELTKSSYPDASPNYHLGYDCAKRDVLIAIARVFAEDAA